MTNVDLRRSAPILTEAGGEEGDLRYTVVVLGKGGVGKTTIAYHLLRVTAARGWAALGVDADAAESLTYLALGDAKGSLYQQVDNAVRRHRMGEAAPRAGYADFLKGSLTHTPDGFDLLTMGQPAGEGCYCAANSAVRELVFGGVGQPRLAAHYRLTVMDCEAGSEKIARRMLGRGAIAVIVANPPDLYGRSESIRVADRIATTIADEIPVVRVVRVLNAVGAAVMVVLPEVWQDALIIGNGEQQLTAAMPLLLNQLIGAAA